LNYSKGDAFKLKTTFTRKKLLSLKLRIEWIIPTNKNLKKNSLIYYDHFYFNSGGLEIYVFKGDFLHIRNKKPVIYKEKFSIHKDDLYKLVRFYKRANDKQINLDFYEE
jgi:hypothetical protein